MIWCFRIRFNLGKRSALQFPDPEWVLVAEGSVRISLRSTNKDEAIAKANSLVLCGSGYATDAHASDASVVWRDRLIRAFASINLGADFGHRAAGGSFTEDGLAIIQERVNSSVLNDVHGTLVYECSSPVAFVRAGSITGRRIASHEKLVDAIQYATSIDSSLSPRELLAYDLYAASFSENSPDARFMMLMMAVETLIDPQPRSPEVQAVVREMIAMAKGSTLRKNEITSIEGSLKGLLKESIGQAGRRLAAKLGERRYCGESAKDFFSHCYTLRSKLAHGATQRPTRSDVDLMAAHLEHFVSDIIGASLAVDSCDNPEGVVERG